MATPAVKSYHPKQCYNRGHKVSAQNLLSGKPGAGHHVMPTVAAIHLKPSTNGKQGHFISGQVPKFCPVLGDQVTV